MKVRARGRAPVFSTNALTAGRRSVAACCTGQDQQAFLEGVVRRAVDDLERDRGEGVDRSESGDDGGFDAGQGFDGSQIFQAHGRFLMQLSGHAGTGLGAAV